MTSSNSFVSVFNTINAVVVPLVKAGLANPLPIGSGLVVLEVPGRRSGRPRITPLTTVALGRYLVVATVRSRSQWIRNLAASQSAEVWWGGRRRAVRAAVFLPDGTSRDPADADQSACVAAALDEISRRAGISIALLRVI